MYSDSNSDENVGRPVVERLGEMLALSSSKPDEVKSIVDYQAQGVPDEDWLPAIADEGWILVTSDLQRADLCGSG